MGEIRKVYTMLVGRSEGKRPLGRPRRRLENNIRMDLMGMWCGVVDWMQLDQDRETWRASVKMVMKRRALLKGGEFLD
jgi:hypothetical protein